MTTLKRFHKLMMENTLSIIMYLIMAVVIIGLLIFVFSDDIVMNNSIYLNYFR